MLSNTLCSHRLQDWQTFLALQSCCFHIFSAAGQHSVKVDPDTSRMIFIAGTTSPSDVTADIALPGGLLSGVPHSVGLVWLMRDRVS